MLQRASEDDGTDAVSVTMYPATGLYETPAIRVVMGTVWEDDVASIVKLIMEGAGSDESAGARSFTTSKIGDAPTVTLLPVMTF